MFLSICVSGGEDFMLTNLKIELKESVTMTSVNISIINDGNYEQSESFYVDLLFSDEPIPGVTLSPNSTEVEIRPNDG